MDDEPEAGRWLGYAELAELRGISKASATRMAFRYRWRRQEGNDGTARVFVPLSALHGKGSGSAIERMAAAIETAMGLFRQRVEAAETRADEAEARAQRAQITAEVERSRADRAEQDLDRERSRADEERRRADGLQHRLDIALQVTHELRRTEEARLALGLWLRLKAAWRGE